MPKRKTQFVQGHYYHIFNRGAGQQSIFRRDADYRKVQRLLKEVAAECEIAIIAYCLLPNHYHWLVRQDGLITPRKLVGRIFGSYSQSFNLTYRRSGTLFEGPFESRHVGNDLYLRHLCCYIHANAVKHTIAAAPELWPYSNYLGWLGQREDDILDRAFIETYYPDISHYQAAVRSYLTGQVVLPPGIKRFLDGLE
ncbi:MAG TPA: transposase [Caldilineaceae bacterium]|nr:transposase [Caldilineaceae bacterium]